MVQKLPAKKELAFRILKVIGTGVLLVVVSVLAPTFPYALLRFYLKKKFNQNYSQNQLRDSVNYIKRKKFIAYKNTQIVLTKQGLEYMREKSLDEITIKKVSWDQRWRFVIFDIPQEKVPARHVLRSRLKSLGFYHFQKSVFVIPYPCENEIIELVSALGVSEHVHTFIAERFKQDKDLVKVFKIN